MKIARRIAPSVVSRSPSYVLMLAGGGSINYRFCGFIIRLVFSELDGFFEDTGGLTRRLWAKVGFCGCYVADCKRETRRGAKESRSFDSGLRPPLRMIILRV